MTSHLITLFGYVIFLLFNLSLRRSFFAGKMAEESIIAEGTSLENGAAVVDNSSKSPQLTEKQKERIERNRQKAINLRQSRYIFLIFANTLSIYKN